MALLTTIKDSFQVCGPLCTATYLYSDNKRIKLLIISYNSNYSIIEISNNELNNTVELSE